MLVGEQPGDQEDLQGHPFVGPAGRELDQALAGAGLDRKQEGLHHQCGEALRERAARQEAPAEAAQPA
jgi:uracil-DNA glycosylase family 4